MIRRSRQAGSPAPGQRARRGDIPRGSRWIPALVGLASLFFTLVVWQILLRHEIRQLDRHLDSKVLSLRGHIETRLLNEVNALARMARRWETRHGTPRDEWEADAGFYLAHQPGYHGVAWVDRDARLQWAVPHMLDQADWAELMRRNPGIDASLQRALQSRRYAFSQTVHTERNERLFLMCVPAFNRGDTDGFIVGLLNAHNFLDIVLEDDIQFDEWLAVIENGEEIYGLYEREPDLNSRWVREIAMRLPGVTWTLRVWPGDATRRDTLTWLPALTLGIGMLLAFLVSATVHLGATASVRADALTTANVELERRVAERTRALRLANEDLRRRRRELERSNEDLEQFAYVASHDLQEPLRMVSSYVRLLNKRCGERLDSDAREYMDFAVDGAERMKRLINDLLRYSRVGMRGKPFQPVDMNHVVADALRDLELAIEDTGATVTHDPLPTVYGDAIQLTQLIENLLGNALKFSGDAPPRVHVAVEATLPADEGERGDAAALGWTFSVVDNGIGIEERHRERIFVIFQRLHRDPDYPGTGIGLAICKKIVERHGGRIFADANPEGGTRIRFTLPAQPPAGVAPEENGDSSPPVDAA